MPAVVRKSQAAMEFLMTYGWSILIIAVVLGALFQLGVFNSANFAPEGAGGELQDRTGRRHGEPQGVCNGALPQSVAQFNGQSSYIQISSSASLNPVQITLALWINPSVISTSELIRKFGQYEFYQSSPSSNVVLRAFLGEGDLSSNKQAATNTWTQIVATFDGTTKTIYLNGFVE